jgi:hypothetical protein
MNALITQAGGLLPAVILLMVCTNVVLTAVKTIIEKIDPTDEQRASNKFYPFLAKAVATLTSAIDWMQGNKEH